MHDAMKNNKKEYTMNVKKLLISKMNSSDMIMAIHTWVASLLQYSGGVTKWNKMKLVTWIAEKQGSS